MQSLSVSNSFATPWTVDFQAPLSMRFFRKEYWSGLACPPPGNHSVILGLKVTNVGWTDSILEMKKKIRPHSVEVGGGRVWDVRLTQFWAVGFFHEEENRILPRKRLGTESVRLPNTKDKGPMVSAWRNGGWLQGQRPTVSAWRDGWVTPNKEATVSALGKGCTCRACTFLAHVATSTSSNPPSRSLRVMNS